MTASQHGWTKGPWVWAEDGHGQRTTLRKSGSGDVVLDPQVDIGDYGLSVDRWTDISDNDAHLIAAAPALYEALENLNAAADAFEAHPEDGNARLLAAMACADAALSLARGEQPSAPFNGEGEA